MYGTDFGGVGIGVKVGLGELVGTPLDAGGAGLGALAGTGVGSWIFNTGCWIFKFRCYFVKDHECKKHDEF